MICTPNQLLPICGKTRRIRCGRKEPLGRPRVDGRTIRQWNFKKQDGGRGRNDLVQDRKQLADCSQHGNVSSVSTKCEEFLYSLRNN